MSEHSGETVLPSAVARCAGRVASAHPPTPIADGVCRVCGERETEVVERWSIRAEFDAEPDTETAVGYLAIAAAAAVMRVLNDDYDLWPEKVEVHRV